MCAHLFCHFSVHSPGPPHTQTRTTTRALASPAKPTRTQRPAGPQQVQPICARPPTSPLPRPSRRDSRKLLPPLLPPPSAARTAASSSSDMASISGPVMTELLPAMPSILPIASPVSAWSPVIILTEMPAVCATLTASMTSSRGGSRIASSATIVNVGSRLRRYLGSITATSSVLLRLDPHLGVERLGLLGLDVRDGLARNLGGAHGHDAVGRALDKNHAPLARCKRLVDRRHELVLRLKRHAVHARVLRFELVKVQAGLERAGDERDLGRRADRRERVLAVVVEGRVVAEHRAEHVCVCGERRERGSKRSRSNTSASVQGPTRRNHKQLDQKPDAWTALLSPPETPSREQLNLAPSVRVHERSTHIIIELLGVRVRLESAVGRIADARDVNLRAGRSERHQRHLVLGQRARLVRADDSQGTCTGEGIRWAGGMSGESEGMGWRECNMHMTGM
eukprot:352726-Chlamydomonas_euryale.AAC.3